ncbi:MAG: F0F1 ATP synthase subunit gamma, partial [Mycoplasma sp.]|nr:F0F1 ATP synthase subunit gamma [Mycoplasma sp.]
MASLSNIRKRISIIQKTSKITQAMKLVSTIKIQHQKNRFTDIANFMDSLYNLLHDLAKSSKYDNVFNNQ